MNLTKKLKQTAIYWESTGPDGFGNDNFNAPVELTVRWQDKAELFIDPQGEEHVSRSHVYCATDFVLGSFLKLGVIESDTPNSPIGEDDAYPIRQSVDSPSIRGDQILYKAIL